MTDPDSIIRANGESVTIKRVTDAAYNDYDEFDPAASTEETETTPAIISDLGYKDMKRLEGRLENVSFKASVPSDVDVSSTRAGRKDRLVRNGEEFKVSEVREIEHPLLGVKKQTLFLEPDPGT